MAGWDTLINEFTQVPDVDKSQWLVGNISAALNRISAARNNTNVILYGSAFLQKPVVPAAFTQITHEDINGFLTMVRGMEVAKGLTLILHTPGGVTNAAETIVAYLHSKFQYVETIVPTYAMSAGTMISLGTNKIVMGRQSQLGPIDPQLPLGNRFVSAEAIVKQFNRAHSEISADKGLAHVWAPILQSMGPALLTEAQNALTYGQGMVARWLEARMFSDQVDPKGLAEATAQFFNDTTTHLSHGRRIDREEARVRHVKVDDLEADSELQDAVLTAYHLMTITFDSAPAAKMVINNAGAAWIKNVGMVSP